MPTSLKAFFLTALIYFGLSTVGNAQPLNIKGYELEIEKYKNTAPYSELLNLNIKKPIGFNGEVDRMSYANMVTSKFTYNINSKTWDKINSTLSYISRYRDNTASQIAECKRQSYLDKCSAEFLKESLEFSEWYYKNVDFMDRLSFAFGFSSFGLSDYNKTQSEDNIRPQVINSISNEISYNKKVAQNMINGTKPKIDLPSAVQRENLLSALSVFSFCEQKVLAMDPERENPFTAYISQYHQDIACELANNFCSTSVAATYSGALDMYEGIYADRYIEKKSQQLKETCTGLASTAKDKLLAIKASHNKEINETNAQPIADFFNQYITAISARCELIHAEAMEMKSKVISPEAEFMGKAGDFLDTWDNSSTTAGRRAGFSPREGDFGQTDFRVKQVWEAYSKTPFVKETHDMFNAMFASPFIQLDRNRPETKIPNPLNRLIASPALNGKLSFNFLITHGFMNACMRYGHPFNSAGLSGFERIRTGSMPLVTDENYQQYKELLKKEVANADRAVNVVPVLNGATILTAKKEVNKLLYDAIEKTNEDIKECNKSSVATLYEPASLNPYYTSKVHEYENKNLEKIIQRYLTTAPVLAIEYIRNNPKGDNYEALCLSLLTAYRDAQTREKISNAIDIALLVSMVLSFGQSSYVAIPARTALLVVGVVDGAMSIQTISEMEKEISTIDQMMAAGFIDIDEATDMKNLAAGQEVTAGFSLIMDAVFIYSGLKGFKLLSLKGKAKPTTAADANPAATETTQKLSFFGSGKSNPNPKTKPAGQKGGQLNLFEETGGKKPPKFVYKKVDAESKLRWQKRIGSMFRNSGVNIADDDALVRYLGSRAAGFNNFCRQLRFCKTNYPSTKAWWSLAIAGSVIRGESTYYGYKKNLGKKKFNPYNFGSDVASGLAKEWLYSYFIVRNTVPLANGDGTINDSNYKLSFGKAFKNWSKKYVRTYVKKEGRGPLKWGMGAEMLSNVGYYFSGGAKDEYGEENELRATLVRAGWGTFWVAAVAVPLKMTIYDLVVGLTCLVPGAKIFVKFSNATSKVTSLVLSYGAQTLYANLTSDLYYAGRNLAFKTFDLKTKAEQEEQKLEEESDTGKAAEIDLESDSVHAIYYGQGEDAFDIELTEDNPALTAEEEKAGIVLYQLVSEDDLPKED